MVDDKLTPLTSSEPLDGGGHGGAPCPHCSGNSAPVYQQFIYSIGKLEVRFPSLGIEREFQQRERQLLLERKKGWTDSGERLFHVLTSNPHLARAVCFVHLVGNIPTYIVAATGQEVMNSLISAIRGVGHPDSWSIIIGKRGPMGTPTTCAGLLAPMMACDQVYTLRLRSSLKVL